MLPPARFPAPRRAAIRRTTVALLIGSAIGCGRDAAPDRPTGDDSRPASTTAFRSACQVLPAADVALVIDETVRDSLALALPDRNAPTVSQCNYSTERDLSAASFVLRRSAPGEGVDAAEHAARRTLMDSGVKPEDVTGLGSVAIWGGNQLHVLIDTGWYLIVTPTRTGGLAQARTLAERALANLAGR